MQLYKKRIFVEQNYTSSMKKEEKVRLPYVPTYGEEVANTVSHAVMLPLTLCLLPFAAVWTYLHDARPVLASVSVSVCVISIFLMLLASTLYHSMRPDSKHKAVFHKLDHIFIFVAIAGTYTPVALLVIGGWQGVFVTVLQWTAVLLGILYKTLARRSIPALSLTIYLVLDGDLFPAPADSERFAASAVADPAGRGALYGRSDRLCEEGIPLPPSGLASVYRPGAVVASGGDRLFYRLIINTFICRSVTIQVLFEEGAWERFGSINAASAANKRSSDSVC